MNLNHLLTPFYSRVNSWLFFPVTKARRSLRCALILTALFVLALTADRNAHLANGKYWGYLFGIHAHHAEVSLLLLLVLFTFWIRQGLFPFPYGDIPETGFKLITRASYFKSLNDVPAMATQWRSPLIWFLLIVSVSYVYHVTGGYGASYRYSTPWMYHLFWNVPIITLVYLCWEVCWSVTFSFQRKAFSTLGLHDIHPVQKKLHDVTYDIIMSFGAFFFFLYTFYTPYFSKPIVGLYSSVVIIQFVLLYRAWSATWTWGSSVIKPKLDLVNNYIETQYQEKYKTDQAVNEWITEVETSPSKRMASAIAEYDFLKGLQERLDFRQWLIARSKDLLPVTILNFAGQSVIVPVLQFLDAFFKALSPR